MCRDKILLPGILIHQADRISKFHHRGKHHNSLLAKTGVEDDMSQHSMLCSFLFTPSPCEVLWRMRNQHVSYVQFQVWQGARLSILNLLLRPSWGLLLHTSLFAHGCHSCGHLNFQVQVRCCVHNRCLYARWMCFLLCNHHEHTVSWNTHVSDSRPCVKIPNQIFQTLTAGAGWSSTKIHTLV